MTRRGMVVAMGGGLLTGCGYHIAGRADLLPKSIRSLYIPAFGNVSTRYRLSDRLAQAITREVIARTRYAIVYQPEDADAVLQGSVVNVQAYPNTFDTVTGRASGIQMVVQMQLNLYERVSGKTLWQNPGFEVRERYEISTDPVAYFDESDTAVDRLSNHVARAVVSAILEAF